MVLELLRDGTIQTVILDEVVRIEDLLGEDVVPMVVRALANSSWEVQERQQEERLLGAVGSILQQGLDDFLAEPNDFPAPAHPSMNLFERESGVVCFLHRLPSVVQNFV